LIHLTLAECFSTIQTQDLRGRRFPSQSSGICWKREVDVKRNIMRKSSERLDLNGSPLTIAEQENGKWLFQLIFKIAEDFTSHLLVPGANTFDNLARMTGIKPNREHFDQGSEIYDGF
jgi:hypothetical protein